MGASLTLFDFEIKSNVSECEIESKFEIFKQDFKRLGNYHSTLKANLSPELRNYYIHFEERGWVLISMNK